jgi:hypothetical protein
MEPASEPAVEQRVSDLSRRGDTLVPCEPLVAQSVVFHALDYAHGLGFSPHPDFARALFEPRPAVLLDTPGAHPERPMYCSGPNDDVASIRRRLDEAVGPGNYDFLIELDDDELDELEDLGLDDHLEDDDEFEDHGVLERGSEDARDDRRRDETMRSR